MIKKSWQKFFWLFLTLFFVFTISFHTNTQAWDQDLGRHIKLGEIILKQYKIPQVNLFSYTCPDFSFLNHHWLSEVIFALLYSWFGNSGLIILKTLLFLISFGLLFWLAAEKAPPFLIALSSILPILVFRQRTDFRPEIFGFLFFSFYLLIFQKAREGKQRWLWVLPILQCLWVNLHISFVFGLFLLGLYFLQMIFEKRKKVSVFLPVLIAAFSVVLNPHFLKGALSPFLIWQNYGYSIAENQSIFFLSQFGYDPNIFFFKLGLVLILLSFIFSKRLASFKFLGWLVLSAVAARQVRHFPFWALYSFLIFADNLSVIWKRLGEVRWRKKLKMGLSVFILLSIEFYGFLYCSNYYYRIHSRTVQFGFGDWQSAKRGTEFLIAHLPQSNIFNNFDIGSYLDYKIYPRMRVFCDSRPEAYPADFWQEYKEAQGDWEKWEELVGKWRIETVFLSYTDQTPWAKQFLANIYHHTMWRLVYLDDVVAIFTTGKDLPVVKLDIEKVLADFGDHSYSLVRLANFANIINRQDLAKIFLERAVTAEPYSQVANLSLATIYLNSGSSALNFRAQALTKKARSFLFWF